MNRITIDPGILRGKVQIPPSKSVAHRAIIAAALSGEPCCIKNVAASKDIQATLLCMKSLGAQFRQDVKAGTVAFAGMKEPTGELVLDCEESGSTLRFLIPVALLWNRPVTLRGKGRLMQRPQTPYLDLFAEKGISCQIEGDALHLQGTLSAGTFSLPGNISSQFVTGLLFALPLLQGDSQIEITTEMESKGYLDLTLSVLKQFGIQIINQNYRRFLVPGGQHYSARDITIEGDYSQAAFFLVAGALGADVQCYGLSLDSLQGDKKILDILKQVGVKVKCFPDGGIQACATDFMQGIVIDAREIPDLVPILAVLCGFCKGESRIINAGRLRMKESDRLSAIATELSKMGLSIKEGADFLEIQGRQSLHGAAVSSWNDHRIAMALSIAACRCEGTVSITGASEAVQKSYPDFFEVYRTLYSGKRLDIE